MRHRIFTLFLLLLGALTLSAQDTKRQVRITTAFDGITVALFDADGQMVTAGKTPYLAQLDAGCDYQYHVRHFECHPDSGYLHIDTAVTELLVPVRLYQTTIDWQVTPEDADYRLSTLKGNTSVYEGKTIGQTTVNSSKYLLKVSLLDYRRHRQVLHLSADSTLSLRCDLQYCPKRFVLAINAGYAPQNNLPLGVTMAYGSVHGIYGRYMQTWFDRADGDDFEADALVNVLTNPYSDQKSEFMSMVVGYQYYTPMRLYLQMGLGYGSLSFNWLSADDGKRHRYAPDTSTGAIVDLGIGYAFGHYYVGAALQHLLCVDEPFVPVCGLINFGICL